MQWLKDQGPAAEPWFLYCSHYTPHPPFDTNATFLAEVEVDKIPIPTWIPENEMHIYDTYMSINKDVYCPYTDAQIQEVRSTYYAMNVEIDLIIGGTINKSYELGYNESNTIYMYTSDHGVEFI